MRLIRYLALLGLTGPPLLGETVPMPDFALLRADEDYSGLAASSLSGWQRLKFVPLSADRQVWLSLGGEVCLRHEYYRNQDWSDALNDHDGYLLTRSYAHADLHAGSLRVFGQLQSSFSEGRRGGPGPIDEDRLDVHQAFASWSFPAAAGIEEAELRLGRQEVQYGSGRLISARAGANTRKSFEGGVARLEGTIADTDLFWLAPLDTQPGTFDNERVPGTWLAGVYTTFDKLPQGLKLDAYVLAAREPERGFVGATGRDRRWSFGLRPWGRLGAWDYNLEFVGQVGRFVDESIRAWTAASDIGYTFETAPWRPRLGLKANIASGDRSPDDGKRETFHALYPKAVYFGEISQVGPANFMNLHPSLTLQPTDDLTLTLDAVFFWRQQLADGLYGPSLRLEREPHGSTARHIGNQFDLLISYRITHYVSFTASAAVFTAGRFLEETGSSETVHYLNTAISFTF
ncbi:MAG TPA: alginate export family protein [Opitutaceae bacterium]